MKAKKFSARVRGGFSSYGRSVVDVDVLVDSDGTVRLWDDVAGHYTVCHSLTESQQRRLRADARRLDRSAQADS